MKIRSITYLLDPLYGPEAEALSQAESFILAARPAFTESGYEVQTVRLATTPFPNYLRGLEPGSLAKHARRYEDLAAANGFDYISLGPAQPGSLSNYQEIPGALAETQNVFFSGVCASREEGISLPAVRACAEVIQRASSLTPDGFANLRFTALAGVLAGSPFFPAAYHAGGAPLFALAIQGADLAVAAFENAGSLEEGRQTLIAALEGHSRVMTRVAHSLAKSTGITFGGIDFTPAPYPEASSSVGAVLEWIGSPKAGLHGSLAATAVLAEAVDRASFAKAGFNGVMLPVLEDSVLADRAAEGVLTITDLLLYSTVCGTGLDTVPLPGDASVQDLAAVLLDVAVLSQRLDKQLTARLMPVPGKKAGDPTGFDFSFFANSRVMGLKTSPLKRFFSGEETFHLIPRSYIK